MLTCTLGEEGEVIPPELAHLASDRDDSLGPWRREELRGAMAAMGVHHRVLGEDPSGGVLSVYRDSGMAGTPTAANPAAFVNADPAEAAAMVADVIAQTGATVVVTYDEHGGYGHPDHIQTHRVTCAAVTSLPERERPDLYAVLTPRSWAVEDRAWLAEHVAGRPGLAGARPRCRVPALRRRRCAGEPRGRRSCRRARPGDRAAPPPHPGHGAATAATPCPTTSRPGCRDARATRASTPPPEPLLPGDPAGRRRSSLLPGVEA